MRQFSYSSFGQPITAEERREFITRYVPRGEFVSEMFGNKRWLGGVALIVGVVLLLYISPQTFGNSNVWWAGAAMAVAIPAACIDKYRRFRKRQATGLIHERFARENGMTYSYADNNLPDATLFHQGNSGTGILRHTVRGRELEFGNYEYEIGYGKHRKLMTCGYFIVHLEREMPHMLLDARKNNFELGSDKSSNLGALPDDSQLLMLEGDFSKHFNLYVPKGSEQSALYIFTPDLMALLIDHGGDCDMEIIGERLFVYLPKAFDETRGGVDYMQQMIDVLVEKIGQRTTQFIQHDLAGVSLEASQLRDARQTSDWLLALYALVGFGIFIAGAVFMSSRM